MEMGKVRINDLTRIHGLCRVCLTESKTMLSLDNKVETKLEHNVPNIWSILYRVTCSEITYDDRYPSYICRMCMGLLNICYKFKLQFEQSQKLLSEYFGESPMEEINLKSVIELVQEEQSPVAPVELISKRGKYDLKDIFVIESAKEEKHNYNGFLSNLGKEVTATFVNNKIQTKTVCNNNNKNNMVSITNVKKCKNNNDTNSEIRSEIPKLNYMDDNTRVLNSFQLNEAPNLDDNDEDDMNESDKKINRRISRCTVCQKIFANKRYLRRHVEHMHLHKKQTFVCEICGVFLKSRSSHYHHMIKHIGKRHKCTFCQKTYFNASNLQQHVMAVHKNERPHLCTICGKSFSYANALDYHMRIHTGERKYKCTYCDKTFTMQCGLSRHLRIHTGHRPYKCKFCEKAFRSKGEVDCHEMTHTGFRPYHCKYCNKGFTKTFNLKMHLLGHPGEHPCEICNKTFIEPQYLKIHLKNNHGYVQEEKNEDFSDTEV